MRFESTEELMIKDELEFWVVRLEKEVDKQLKRFDSGKYKSRYDVAEKIYEKLEEENYSGLVKEIFNSLLKTENNEYYKLYKRICRSVYSIGKGEYEFGLILNPALKEYLFETKTEVGKELLSKLIAPFEFNGKQYSIEEYLDLSIKVSNTNAAIMFLLTASGINTEIDLTDDKEMQNKIKRLIDEYNHIWRHHQREPSKDAGNPPDSPPIARSTFTPTADTPSTR